MPNWIFSAIERIIPPAGSPDPQAEYQWRFAILTAVVILAIMSSTSIVHGLYAHGFIFGSSGYATRDEMKEIHLAILRPELRQLRIQHCQAIENGNRAAAVYAWREIENKAQLFLELTGRAYVVPDCESLGVVISGMAEREESALGLPHA